MPLVPAVSLQIAFAAVMGVFAAIFANALFGTVSVNAMILLSIAAGFWFERSGVETLRQTFAAAFEKRKSSK